MSRIPAAVDRLVQMLTVGLPGVQVIDGPPVIELEKTGVSVGYSPDVLSVVSIQEGAGLVSESETFDVNCLAWQRSGDTDMKTVRDAVFAIVGNCDTALAGDRRLGGAVVNAYLRVVDLDQTQTDDGM